jgi:voltage-gated potassium channel Kch
MEPKISLGDRLRYGFDKSMAAGPIALIGWLTFVTLLVILVASAVLAVGQITNEGAEPLGFGEAFWQALMRTLDAGTMAGDAGWGFRLVMLLITLAGIFIVSALIGLISSGINDKLVELRKGRSRVLERGHTVILNWSPSIFDIISELVIANASERRPRLVIMAAKDKVEMEDEIAAKVGDLGRLKIICRHGDPTDLFDLQLVSPQLTKSIIVLSPETDDPDSQVIKTVLALVHAPGRRKDRYRIAAEIRNASRAKVARKVGGDEVQLVLADDLIARIIMHSSRQSGLSAVFLDLLDFSGCEIYVGAQPELARRTFGDALMAYERQALIGLADGEGRVRLNPPMDTVIAPDTRAIVIAEDNSLIKVAPVALERMIDLSAVQSQPRAAEAPEQTLVLGWNRRGRTIVSSLASYLPPGSTVMVVADAPGLEHEAGTAIAPEAPVKLVCRVADSSSREVLVELGLAQFRHVIVLSATDQMPIQAADTRALVTLLHLREIIDEENLEIGVVSEIADVRNRPLAEVTRADDFVVSNKLVSLMLAQASENECLAAIFDDLLDSAGSEIYLRPVEDYVAPGRPVTFYTVVEAARRRGEVAFGYRRAARAEGTSGVVLSPAKAEPVSFAAGDRIVVLAES